MERERERDGRDAMRMREGAERETDREHKGGREMLSARQGKGLRREKKKELEKEILKKKGAAQAMRQKTDRREHSDGPPIDSRLGNKVS